jgi:hypothetical protein
VYVVCFYAMLIEKASSGARRAEIIPAGVAPTQQLRKIYYQTVRETGSWHRYCSASPLLGRNVDKKLPDLIGRARRGSIKESGPKAASV